MTRARLLTALGLLAALAAVAAAGVALAQTDPPPLGLGDWTVSDTTVLQDRFIMLRGDVRVTGGGSLTLRNATILFVLEESGEHGILVEPGGTLRILDGSRLGSSRTDMGYTFTARRGSTVRMFDSAINDCGNRTYGYRADWQNISVYVGTVDAAIERCSFSGGFVSLCIAEGMVAPTVRNCTFEGSYGLVTWGTSAEDCTFVGQNYYGVLVMGGNETRIERCRFVSLPGAGVTVGLDERPIGPINPADALIRDCSFERSQVGVRVSISSHGTIADCVFDSLSIAAIYPEPGELDDPPGITSYVELFDGTFRNCSRVFLAYWRTMVNWTVTSYAEVVGGNVSLSGNLVLQNGSHLRLVDFHDLTQGNREGRPVSIRIGDGAHLELLNGSLQVPLVRESPSDWRPIRIEGANGTLTLTGASQVNVSFPVALRELRCERSTIPLGEWSARVVQLKDCTLRRHPRTASPMLAVGPSPPVNGSRRWSMLDGCPQEGLPVVVSGQTQPWLVLNDAWLTCIDSLGDITGPGAAAIDVVGEDTSQLVVRWRCQATVVWQNRVVVPGARVTILDDLGQVYSRITDASGSTEIILIDTEYVVWDMSSGGPGEPAESYLMLPLTFKANASGLLGTVVVENITEPLRLTITLVDDVLPTILLDQNASLATNKATVRLTGWATDAHSGVAFLEVAIVPFPYTRVVISAEGAFEAVVDLHLGLQTISLRVYDLVGNRAERRVEVYRTNRPPSVDLIAPANGAWLNTTLVAVEGMTEKGATVEVLGRKQVAETGHFLLLVPVHEGPNTLLINVTDRAGNRNQSAVQVNVDTEEPTLTLTELPALSRSSAVNITGTTEPDVKVYVNGVDIEVDEGGRFTARVNLAEGLQVVTVTAVDRAGNAAMRQATVTIDSTPPHLDVLWPPEEPLLTNATSIIVRILTDAGAIVTINGRPVATPDPLVLFRLDLSEGANPVLVVARDGAGNPIEVERAVLVSRRKPTIAVNPALPSGTEETFLRIAGTTQPNATVSINGFSILVGPDGSFSRTVLLSEGLNTIEIGVTDEYGNVANATYVVKMVPHVPGPRSPPGSLVLELLALTAVVLVLEGVLLKWRRARREAAEAADPDASGEEGRKAR